MVNFGLASQVHSSRTFGMGSDQKWSKMAIFGHFWRSLFENLQKWPKNRHFGQNLAQIPASSGINGTFFRDFLDQKLHVVRLNLGFGKNAPNWGIFTDPCRKTRFRRQIVLRNVGFWGACNGVYLRFSSDRYCRLNSDFSAFYARVWVRKVIFDS